MKIKLNSLLFILFNFFFITANSQICDCTIIPFKSGCEKECGLLEYIKNDDKGLLIKHLKVKPETAERIVQIKNRKLLRLLHVIILK